MTAVKGRAGGADLGSFITSCDCLCDVLGRGQVGREIIGSFLITKVEQHTLGDNAECASSQYQEDQSLWLLLNMHHVTVSLFLLEEENDS